MRSVRGKLLSSKEKKLFVRVVKSDVAFYGCKNFPPSDHFFTLLSQNVFPHPNVLDARFSRKQFDGAKLKSIQFYDVSSK